MSLALCAAACFENVKRTTEGSSLTCSYESSFVQVFRSSREQLYEQKKTAAEHCPRPTQRLLFSCDCDCDCDIVTVTVTHHDILFCRQLVTDFPHYCCNAAPLTDHFWPASLVGQPPPRSGILSLCTSHMHPSPPSRCHSTGALKLQEQPITPTSH